MSVTTTMSMRSGRQKGGNENGPETQNGRSENDIGISSPPGLELEHLRQEGLLRVQAVLGFVEVERPRTVQHLVRNLLASVRGQAMHHHGMARRPRQERRVDLIRMEDAA